MYAYLLVFAGGGLGALCRFAATSLVGRSLGTKFPWGTMAVNVAGSLAMGLVIAWLGRRSAGDAHLRLLLATGFLGGFTTFSAFSLDAVSLYERGAITAAAGYIAASVVVSILALFAGLVIGRQF
ncbi:MAG: fluoride efflux transporter CrcB [Rhizobiales bacterium]|nr:fluoride efflux transporter CrcB [Hyphomicrobiales bacterium]